MLYLYFLEQKLNNLDLSGASKTITVNNRAITVKLVSAENPKEEQASAEFSFLLAFPVMSAVTAYDMLKHYHEFSDANLIILAVGFVTSFIVAYLTIKLFLKFLETFTFVFFGVYRIIFGVVLLLFFN